MPPDQEIAVLIDGFVRAAVTYERTHGLRRRQNMPLKQRRRYGKKQVRRLRDGHDRQGAESGDCRAVQQEVRQRLIRRKR